jgi:hypothetical protein
VASLIKALNVFYVISLLVANVRRHVDIVDGYFGGGKNVTI